MANNTQALAQELLRKQLRPAEYITHIEEALGLLREHGMHMAKNQIDAQKVLIDGYGRLLAKCLPDLRAIEVTPESASPVKFIFMNGVTATSEEVKQALDKPDTPTFRFNS